MENKKRSDKMSYYCTECEKEHSMGYKKHYKYKGLKYEDFLEGTPIETEEFVAAAVAPDLKELLIEINEIKRTLDLWSYFIERKHPYFVRDKKWKEWIGDD